MSNALAIACCMIAIGGVVLVIAVLHVIARIPADGKPAARRDDEQLHNGGEQ